MLRQQGGGEQQAGRQGRSGRGWKKESGEQEEIVVELRRKRRYVAHSSLNTA